MTKFVKLFLFLFVLSMVIESCGGPKSACGGKGAHKARSKSMKRKGMTM